MAHKLLLADDSITIQKVVELVLAEEDFEIKSVSNGEDALALMNTFTPDIVLADIEMPKINGYQLCDRIKKDPKTAGIPVILLAGAFEPMDDDLARSVGADDSVIKPFESQELISKINSVLTMVSAGEAGEAVVMGTEEDAVELMEAVEEEVEAGIEPEAAEAVGAGEDLWAMEDLSAAAVAVPEALSEELTAEAMAEDELGSMEKAFEIAEEEVLEETTTARETISRPQPRREVSMQEVVMPSREEVLGLLEKTVNEKVSSLLSGMDIKQTLIASLMPLMKDSIDKVLWEIAPDLVEKMLKEVLRDSVSSISKEVEKVIWETVPDLAGTMISKEIEKIKSEF